MTLSLPGLLMALALAVAPLEGAAAPFAYVPNEGSGTLSIIDTATDQVVGEVAVGQKPRGTVVSADGRTAYVSDQPSNVLVIVDLVARKRSGTIAVGASPEGVGLSPDGRWVAAAVEETNEIVFVDTRTNAKSFVVKVRGKNPEHAVFTPDGRFVFVSAEDGEAVDIIDVAKRAQVGQVPVGARPRGIAFSADSKRAYVAAENSNAV
jgi:YVTN family beta-propeller protein